MMKHTLTKRPEETERVHYVIDPKLYNELKDAEAAEEDTIHALLHQPHPKRYWEWVRCTLAGSLLVTIAMLIATLITIPLCPNDPLYPKILQFSIIVCVVHVCILYEDVIRVARIARKNWEDLTNFFLAILPVVSVVSILAVWFFIR
jgi:hypothetical protein